ncbi:MAG: hypothetical protein HXY21_00355 [Parvularculaceae bacterium]|nr:hypothetical protein [Parvularculaceae bacterium]
MNANGEPSAVRAPREAIGRRPDASRAAEADSAVRVILGVAWRARGVVFPLAAAFVLVAALGPQMIDVSSATYLLIAAVAAFLLALIIALALRVRAYVEELSRQILDIADGASRPPEGAVKSSLELETEIARLREEVERLKDARSQSGGPVEKGAVSCENN